MNGFEHGRTGASGAILPVLVIAGALALSLFAGTNSAAFGWSALLTAAMMVALAVGLRSPFVLLLATVLFIPLEYVSAFGGATIGRFLVPVLAVVWAPRVLRRRSLGWNPAMWIMTGWLAWAALSRLWSTGRRWGAQMPPLLLGWMLFIIVADEVNTRERLLWVLRALVAGMAVFTVVWFATGTLAVGVYFVPESAGGGVSEYGNLIAAVLGSALVLALYTPNPMRVVAALATLPVGYLVLAVGLRRGLLTTAAILVALFLFAKGTKRRALVLLILATVAAYAAWDYLLPHLPQVIQDRFTIEQVIETGGTGRLGIWSVALDVWRKSPIAGIGQGEFGVYSMLTPETGYRPSGVHNMPIQVLVELGAVGFVLWCLGWLLIAASAVRAYRAGRTDAERLLSGLPLALVVYFLVNTLMNPIIGWRLMWLALGLAVAAERVFPNRASLPGLEAERAHRSSPLAAVGQVRKGDLGAFGGIGQDG